MIKSIKKRDGRIVFYDANKIAKAVLKAMEVSGEGSASDAAKIANDVEQSVESICDANTPSIEQIQDQVEKSLMKAGFDATAKKYILYRASRSEERRVGKECR